MKKPGLLLSFGLFAFALALGCTDEVEDVAEGDATTGEVKTLTGEVVAVIDARTFTMKDEHKWLEDDLLTVVSKTDLPFDLNDEDEITVTGTVQNVAYTEIESGYDWDFDPVIEAELEEIRGFFIADSVVVTEHEDAD
ncbi:hypothetical protein [Roseimaritima sediminicola]|uniref:hypothetical protein n=1 Tax=Roseimaritima sediminicola TaxID=2662066 RepID=UPI0012983CE3|nr:hypothetical protein [Roseimaritima sediminicola]